MTTKQTSTIALFPFLIGLRTFAEKGIKTFLGNTNEQIYTLGLMPATLSIPYPSEEIKAFISENPEELNTILKEHGFDIQLDTTRPFDLGVVTIMDLIGEWLEQAKPKTVTYGDTEYDAALIKKGASIVSTTEDKELLMIRTKKGLFVFIEKDKQARSGFELAEYIFKQSETVLLNEIPCDACIPCVNLDDQPDMTWLQGIYSNESGTPFIINQVLQQNRLEINLGGIHAQSATAIGIARGISLDEKPVFTVNTPFNIWLAYTNADKKYFPLFAAHVEPDTWHKSI